jgi:hypothetical protein
MKSAVWVSTGPETMPLIRQLVRDGYRRVETQRLRSEEKACHPKRVSLFVKEVNR